MPEYIVSNGGRSSERFAQIDLKVGRMRWAWEKDATAFSTPELAKKALREACDAMLDKGRQEAAEAVKKGSIVKGELGHKKAKAKAVSGAEYWVFDPTEFFVPEWLWLNRKDLCFPIVSRTSPQDAMAEFDQFFVRSAEGWLSRPSRARCESALVWSSAFDLAAPFYSLDAAQKALGALGTHWISSGHILTARSVFVAVTPVGNPPPDDLAQNVMAGVEARVLRAAAQEGSATLAASASGQAGQPGESKSGQAADTPPASSKRSRRRL